ncbi:MAG: SGNH/GDSL hydrolase family protein [Clostridia bacterium]
MNQAKKVVAWVVVFIFISSVMGFAPATNVSAAVDFDVMKVPTISTALNGFNIVKTMYLLETSTAEKPNTVRIAVTGQSISDTNNSWPVNLVAWLRVKYPTANILYQNFAIGGFAASTLFKRVPNDMASFFPDLVILYDYGDPSLIERMIQYCRETIGAEVMLQTYHYTGADSSADSSSFGLLPDIAVRNTSELCEIRKPWKLFLDTNALQPSVLLLDGVHLNPDGQTLMLGLMKQFFIYRESNAASVISKQTVAVQPTDWVDGKLTIPFKGTRVEVVSGTGTQSSTNVSIDGKKPSEFKEAYIRSAEFHGMLDTNIGIIGFNSVPKEQLWTIEVTAYTNPFTFTVKATGDLTGDEGVSVDSVLNGPHLKLNRESFIWDFNAPTVGKKYTFQSILNGCDLYNGTKNTVVSGIPNVNHTLVLQAVNPAQIPDIAAIRFYDPSISAVSNTPRPITELPNRPEIYFLTDKTLTLAGYALDQGTITITIGTVKYTTIVDKNGDWKKTFKKPFKTNTKISVTITVNGVKSLSRIVYVGASMPTINKVTSKSKSISGSSYAKAKISIKINGKWRIVYANAKGLYVLKLTKTLKKGSFIYAKATYLLRTSAQRKAKIY